MMYQTGLYEFFEEALKNLADCILFLDHKTQVIFMNEAAQNILGDLYGRVFEEVLPQSRSKDLMVQDFVPIAKNVSIGKRQFILYERKISSHVRSGVVVILRHSLNSLVGDISKKKEMLIKSSSFIPRYSFAEISSNNSDYLEAIRIATKVAKTNAGVLILGESGTGKEVFAQAIHYESKRNDGPFIGLNCSAIPKELFEAELFGYEEGAFTGARKNGKLGYFEMANGGTLFLDEIGEIPIEMQAKLLRVIQEREITRVGSSKASRIDFRLIAATNIDLYQSVIEGKFRSDLYYRLHVVRICIPPLRSRMDDLPSLIENLLKRVNERNELNICGVSGDAMEKIVQYDWPGNIRQLENVLEQAAILCDGEFLTALDIRVENITGFLGHLETESKSTMEELERQAILNSLEQAQGSKIEAAKKLGISRATIYNKIRKYGINYRR
ncbi:MULTISPECIES: sigma-54 interaction domain-containing protein [Brevibacillus]|nr:MULTISPECIES: sigma 54-interacting transcriptional regulator [Brevibacillus]MED1950122.1 sigma 54-interacting transcriptional regulator [Brevibacillus centrosporus]